MSADTKPRRFLRLPDVERKVGLKKTRIYELVAEGKFPAAIKLTDSTNAWLEHEVEAWMDERIAASRPGFEPDQLGGQSGGTSSRGAALRVV